MPRRKPTRPLDEQARGLAERNRWLVIFTLKKMRLHRHPRSEDLVGAGMVGLCGAARDFDPGRGVAFSTYAVRAVRWSILAELGRLAAGIESQLPAGTDGAEWEPEAPGCAAGDALERAELAELLARLCAEIPGRDRLAVELLARGASRADIAARLGVGRARVGQILARALGRLRRRMEG